MANLAHLGPTASLGIGGYRSGQAGRVAPRHGLAFHHVLASAMNGARVPRAAMAAPAGVQTVAARVPLAVARITRAVNPTSMIPAQSDAALSQAMTLEGVPPASWQSGLRFIMAQESGGRVDVKNPVHSARGLFQLTAANYHLNPNGARSFGNAVEEAQGGIRYIQQRYGTADNAVAFWNQHRWY
jgi:Transglycosylase SLT domain